MTALEAQRRMTRALIDDDPTEAVLIPRVKAVTASGASAYTDGPPRASQRFKLSLLSFDQRPTATLAGGVARLVDYHLIGPHDMAIEIGDHWTAEDGTRYDVTGFTEGWNYMRKAFVVRTLKGEKVVPAL